jgi:hypothetical protein
MMVCVMPRHVPTLLRIDERVKMTMQPSGEHRTCYRERLRVSFFDGAQKLRGFAASSRQRYDDVITDTTRCDGGS